MQNRQERVNTESFLTIDFDRDIPRNGTSSVKHDGRAAYFGTADVLPLWVADMDFASPEAVTRALQERAAHPVYGYTLYPESAYEALMDWLKKRHGWEVQREWIVMAPGVVPSLFASVMAFAQEGEGVIVQPPVYFPFFSAVTTNRRRLIENPLRLAGDRYEIDFEISNSAPPTVRGSCCSARRTIRWGACGARQNSPSCCTSRAVTTSPSSRTRYTPTSSIPANDTSHSPRWQKKPTRSSPPSRRARPSTFPDLGLSCVIAPNAGHRHAIKHAFETLHVSNTNPFSIAAFEAAYRGGEAWLDSLLVYLQGNRDFVCDYVAQHLPAIKVIQSQGTYLLWLDCRGLGHERCEIARIFCARSQGGHESRHGVRQERQRLHAAEHRVATACDRGGTVADQRGAGEMPVINMKLEL